MAIGETLALAPEYSRAKSGAAHLFALLEKKPTIESYSQEGKKPVSTTMIVHLLLIVHIKLISRLDCVWVVKLKETWAFKQLCEVQ